MSEMRLTDSTAVLALWWIAVGLAVLVIVPLALHLLHHTLRAALSLRRFAEESLEAVGALERTVASAGPLVPGGARLREKTARLADVLTERGG